jgi:hypothetical protein
LHTQKLKLENNALNRVGARIFTRGKV